MANPTPSSSSGGHRRLAVLGSPIAHSQSPALHAAAYAQLGLDWAYERVELHEHELPEYLRSRDAEWRGLSLTMPLKFVAAQLVDECDRVARLTGAVNTVIFDRGEDGERMLRGFNTDVAGIVRSLAEHGIREARRVLVLGGGATAGSALAAAAELGAESATVAVRTPAKASHLHELAAALGLTLDIVALDRAVEHASRSQLVISTLPGGAAAEIEFEAATCASAPLYDVAYSPWPSALASEWRAAGGSAYSGIGMLVQQALIQIRIFVAGDPFEALPNEAAVLGAMRAAAGLATPGTVEV